MTLKAIQLASILRASKPENNQRRGAYKGFKGHIPIEGHLAEYGLIGAEDFRYGNTVLTARI